ncbi:MAG: transposase [Deltaproteobacteria bacterium]|nr:transposase [Deltaproteobacteria bacterium]
MPRQSRLDAPGVLHHVMGRGIEKRNIFINDADRHDFIERLGALSNEGAMDIYAWALLPNHFHLLCKTRNRPLASSMRKLLTGYVVNFNHRHRRHGHLFQNRYKSIVCQEDKYFKELVRYIHLNLLRAGLVDDFAHLAQSPWSGHSAVLGFCEFSWQDTEYVLSHFGHNHNGRSNYLQFVKEGTGQGRRPELVGGGLVRSLGGWSEVLALRSREQKVIYDQRILGDGKFVQQVTKGLEDLEKRNLRLSRQRIDIDSLAARVSRQYKISVGELCSGSRRQRVVQARAVLSWVGVRELGYSGAEVARYLGVTNSCVTRIAASDTRPPVEELIEAL